VRLSKHILDHRKKQTGTLRISENVTFTNDDVIGALQQKLPRAPRPFDPAPVFMYGRACREQQKSKFEEVVSERYTLFELCSQAKKEALKVD